MFKKTFIFLSVVGSKNKNLAAIVLSILTISRHSIKMSNGLNLFEKLIQSRYNRGCLVSSDVFRRDSFDTT